MDETYAPLPSHAMDPGTSFALPAQAFDTVTPDDPALRVMTDFRQVRALTVPAGASMDAAYQRMRVNGVRLLLAVDDDNMIVGLITSADVEGEKPIQLMQDRAIRRDALLVADVMTPRDRLEVLEMRDLEHARVGHVASSLRAMGRQHAMVVERDAEGRQSVRGLFSASQLERQLGEPIQTATLASSFAEVEKALVR